MGDKISFVRPGGIFYSNTHVVATLTSAMASNI